MNLQIETVVPTCHRCSEGPIWDAAQGRLIWVDIENALIYQMTLPDTTPQVLSRGLPASGLALNQDGSLVLTGSTGLHLWHGSDNYQSLASQHEGEALFFNDNIADPKGRVYSGTLHWNDDSMETHGKLYLIQTNGSLEVVDDGIELSNGLGFSPDNKTLYFSDSSARKIYAYDIDLETGRLANKRVFVQIPGDEGLPDGLTVDAQGFIWVAQWYGQKVVRYDPDGKVQRRIAMPVKQVSSVCFGGPDMTTLYITSAGDSWVSELAPPGYDFNASDIGGPLYRIQLDIQGKKEHLANITC